MNGNEAASVPGEPVKVPWELSYYFERKGWTLVDEYGNKIEPVQGGEIRNFMKAHEKGK